MGRAIQRLGSNGGTGEALKEEYMKTKIAGNAKLPSPLGSGSRERRIENKWRAR
jgi:hypothetical protein